MSYQHLQILLFNSVGDKWLQMKSSAFWSKSAEFVHQLCKTAHTRTGTFVCTSTLYYQCNALYIGNACRSQVVTKLSKNFKSPCDAEKYFKTKSCDIAPVSITRQSNIEEVSQQFQCYCDTIGIHIPNDFLQLAIAAMCHLKANQCHNVLYDLAKGIGTLRADKSDSIFPVK